MIDIAGWAQQHFAELAAPAAVGAALWGVARYAPALLAPRLKAAFLRLRSAGFFTNPAKPKRLRAYLAALECLEDEIPDRGDPAADAYFLELGDAVASHLPPLIRGSAKTWGKAIRALSDEVDDDLDAEIAQVRQLAGSPNA